MRGIQSKSISRGEFLKVAGIFCTAGVITACNLEAITTQIPPITSPPNTAPPATAPPIIDREQRLQSVFNLTP